MNSSSLIQYFAESGYLIDQAALSYVRSHDHKHILDLFNELNPETLVIDLPGIRKLHRAKRSNCIVRYVSSFPARPVLVKKEQSFFEKVRDGLSIHSNGGQK